MELFTFNFLPPSIIPPLASFCLLLTPLLSFLQTTIASSHDYQFSFTSFQSNDPDLLYLNDASAARGAAQLTYNSLAASIQNSTGRVMYKRPFKFWDPACYYAASFNTTFEFQINTGVPIGHEGDGLAFVMAPDTTTYPSEESCGEWLGLYDKESNGKASNYLVAVEFDTFKNSFDPDDNHVGLDLNGIVSAAKVSLTPKSIFLKGSYRNISVWIDYDGKGKMLEIFVANATRRKPLGRPVLSYHVDLRRFLKEEIFVGFSASTGNASELHHILSWNFSINGMPAVRIHFNNIAVIVGPTITALFLLILVLALFRRQRIRTIRSAKGSKINQLQEPENRYGPRRFTIKELTKATKKFSAEEKLGQGGFGAVYRGILPKEKTLIAVKRIREDSRQGEREFIAEVTIIGRLRHRNLVQLQGWCHERGELLLVYDYMPNGSLDKWIFETGSENVLPWDHRYNIVRGLASALLYLHEEWEQQVVHRDVKASNVMLDAEFNARLGDFGLARMVEHNKEGETTVLAGTPGYMAPECFQTGKATRESDVFSFGAVALEVACGRRPRDSCMEYVVDWVWSFYTQGRLLEAVDPRLGENYDKDAMTRLLTLGLVCSNHNPQHRPSMREVLQALIQKESLVELRARCMMSSSMVLSSTRSPSSSYIAKQQNSM